MNNCDTLSIDDQRLLHRIRTYVYDLNTALDDASKAGFTIYVRTPIMSVGDSKTVTVDISRRYSYPDDEVPVAISEPA